MNVAKKILNAEAQSTQRKIRGKRATAVRLVRKGFGLGLGMLAGKKKHRLKSVLLNQD